MRIINDNASLLRYVPNTLTAAKGESSLFEKLSPWLESSEIWLANNIVGGYIDAIAENDTLPLFDCCAKIIASDAMMNAIPSLDIVLTPNGFGIVNTSNIAPASKERIERLIASLENFKDYNIHLLLSFLCADKLWSGSQKSWFLNSFCQNLDVCDTLGITAHRWSRFLEIRQKAILIESDIAESYFSDDLLVALRSELSMSGIDYRRSRVASDIKNEVIDEIRTGVRNRKSLVAVVDVIRKSQDLFPEWHNSEVASLFSPPLFVNDKKSKGYWF